MWIVEYYYPMIKIYGLRVGLVKYASMKLHILPANGKQRPSALTNKEREYDDQMHADN
jgi:hypothetical protein